MGPIRSIAAAAMVLALAVPAYAQEKTSPVRPSPAAPEPLPPEPEEFNLTPFIGVGFSGDLENAPASFGVALGYGMTSRVGVEGELSFAPAGEQSDFSDVDTRLTSLSANVLYHFTPDMDFTPYVAGGLGWLHGEADFDIAPVDMDDTTNTLSVNFGGGVKTAMNDRWGLRADLRYFVGDDFAADHWRLYGGVIIRRLGR